MAGTKGVTAPKSIFRFFCRTTRSPYRSRVFPKTVGALFLLPSCHRSFPGSSSPEGRLMTASDGGTVPTHGIDTTFHGRGILSTIIVGSLTRPRIASSLGAIFICLLECSRHAERYACIAIFVDGRVSVRPGLHYACSDQRIHYACPAGLVNPIRREHVLRSRCRIWA